MDVPTDTELVTLAGRRYRREGARDKAIRDQFSLTATRFWQLVVAVLDSPTRIGALPPELWPVVKRLDERRKIAS
ncbi:DUF3263 domain-containing protein [Jatrophihabitans sp.]|uniref:DUF3263 domain-containing protein n=1 Tax=Jatrophihabitans sp. TaxID=1932789 RepID=UPI0030C68291|nr:hypothetical protein [Jatrophihabitans sp.]